MTTSVDLTDDEIGELKRFTNQTDSSEAVRAAMQDYLRYARRMQLKQLSGQVEMLENWQQLEQRELITDADTPDTGAD